MTDPSLFRLSKEELIARIDALQSECNELRLRLGAEKPISMFNEAVENISEAVVIYDKDGGLLAWNQNFADLYGYTAEELKPGVHYSELGRIDLERGNVAVGDEFGDGEEYLKRKAQYREKLEGSFIVRLKDGRWIKTTDRPMGNGGFVSVQVDVTELKRLEERMRYMAQHDMLTQMPNRNRLVEQGALILATAKRNKGLMAVLFIDIDDFKRINDNYGHMVGDEVLREIANRLRRRLRETDLIARVGGDEFVVLLSQQFDEETAKKVADDLIDQMAQVFHVEGVRETVGVSIGIAYYPRHGENLDGLIQKADTAMYEAKAQGKNKWAVFVPTVYKKDLPD